MIISILLIVAVIIAVIWFFKKQKKNNLVNYAVIGLAGLLSGASQAMIQLACVVANIESGFFTSELFSKGKNAFGMQTNTRVKDQIVVDGIIFAKYPSLLSSAKDFFTLMKSYYGWTKDDTYDQLFQKMLDKNYMGDDPTKQAQYSTFVAASAQPDAKPTLGYMSRAIWIFALMVILPTAVVIAIGIFFGLFKLIKEWILKMKKKKTA